MQLQGSQKDVKIPKVVGTSQVYPLRNKCC